MGINNIRFEKLHTPFIVDNISRGDGSFYLFTENKAFDDILEEYEPKAVAKYDYNGETIGEGTPNITSDRDGRSCIKLGDETAAYWYIAPYRKITGPEEALLTGEISLTIDGKKIKNEFKLFDRNYDSSIEEEGYVCVAEGTKITLADRTQVPVEELTGKEKVLVWNLYEGKYEESDIAFIMNHDGKRENREIAHLYFSDGSDVEVIYSHGFYDLDLNKCVAITSSNYKDYIGHKFVKQADSLYEEVTLDRVDIEHRETVGYELVTPKHLTCFTNGIYSVATFLEEYLNTFEVDKETLTYNKEKMEKDIETYGLTSYDEMKDKLPKYVFDLFNSQYMKVRIGKGIVTEKQIEFLINYYNTYLDKLVNDSIK